VLDRRTILVAEHDQVVALQGDVLGHAVAHQADADETDPWLAHFNPAPLSAR
jgi:hypothetical protein